MFLFDTDVITNVLKKRPSKTLLDRLSRTPMREQYISTITISEIVYGAAKSNRPEYHLKNLENILLPSVNVVGLMQKLLISVADCGPSWKARGCRLTLQILRLQQ